MNKELEELLKQFKQPLGSNDRVKTINRMAMSLNGHDIKDNDYEPQPGDKVLITNFRDPIDGNLVAKISRQKYSIIESSFPIPIGSNGDYHFEYQITIENGDGWNFMQGDYHILTEKEIKKLEIGFRL